MVAAVLVGCGHKEETPPAPSAPVKVSLAAGTKVPAILTKGLESGVDDEGTEVSMVASEDVKDAAGHVLIAKGAPVKGSVSWSRRESTTDAITNRPARLKFKFTSATAVDGQTVDLCADTAKPDEPYELNRGNTGTEAASQALDAMIQDDKDKEVLDEVSDLVEKGDMRVLLQPDSKERLASIAQRMQMPELQTLAQSSINQDADAQKIKTMLEQVRSGGNVSVNGAPGLMSNLMGVMQLASLAGQIGDRLGRALHGRNIKAYPGTPVEAYVLKDVQIAVKS